MRRFILFLEGRGIFAQVFSIMLFSAMAFPLLSVSKDSSIVAHAPISHFKVPRAFVLGICMKIILGCGSGVRINAGSGNSHVLFVLLFFALGSFSGALVLNNVAAVINLGIHILQHDPGLVVNLISFALVSGVCCFCTTEMFHF